MGDNTDVFIDLRRNLNIEWIKEQNDIENGLSVGDRLVVILHNQAMIWDKLKELEEEKCCKD